MKLYIIMLTFNCVNYTHKTLGSFKTNLPHNWIIIDNNSTDDTQKLLDNLAKFPNQIHIRNKNRVGVSTSWNLGLKRAMQDPEFKYAFVINNDIELEPYCVDCLVSFVETHPEYVIVSGLNTRDFKKQVGGVGEDCCDFAAFIITKECIDKVGLFDENFVGAYFEDNDYHFRVQKARLKSCVVQDAGFYHYGSKTLHDGLSPPEQQMAHENYEKNKDYFKQKWGSLPK